MVFREEAKTTMVKLVGLTPFPILPAHFGGAERCWNVLSRLLPEAIHALSWEGKPEQRVIGGIAYEVTPASEDAQRRALQYREMGFITHDAMPHVARVFLDEYRELVEAEQPDVVVLEHPWLVDFVPDGVPWIYDSHNAEALAFGRRFGAGTSEFLHVKELERRAVQGAKAVTYCSEADAVVLREMFGDFHGVHVPNGVVLPELSAVESRNILLFVGSVYQPNIDAAQRLINLAPQLPGFDIVIAGPCSHYVQNLQPNVRLLGSVSDRKLDQLFRESVAFVNLVSDGSGTHLKVGRALAYGVPVITSQIGGRGYSSPIVTDDVPGTLADVVKDWQTFSDQARAEAELLTWDKVVEPMRELVGR
jgi:glycosyltransferase involved in cell wall biosynthesis